MARLLKNSGSAILKSLLLISTLLFTATALAEQKPSRIIYVGAISIDPCQDAKVLAEWYGRLGIETTEYSGGYYGQIETAAGPLIFGIHPKDPDAPAKCHSSISVVYRVDKLDAGLSRLEADGLTPFATEEDEQGHFAHFRDPDGNKVTLWGE